MLTHQYLVAGAIRQNCICAGSVTQTGKESEKIKNADNNYEFWQKQKWDPLANPVAWWQI